MYRRPKFLEELLEIREQMSRDSYFDVDLFAEKVRNGKSHRERKKSEKKSVSKPATKASGKIR